MRKKKNREEKKERNLFYNFVLSQWLWLPSYSSLRTSFKIVTIVNFSSFLSFPFFFSFILPSFLVHFFLSTSDFCCITIFEEAKVVAFFVEFSKGRDLRKVLFTFISSVQYNHNQFMLWDRKVVPHFLPYFFACLFYTWIIHTKFVPQNSYVRKNEK